MASPHHPVIIGSSQLANTNADAEPIAMMVEASEAALADVAGVRGNISEVAVVKGINTYADPGRLIAGQLGIEGAHTTYTPVGGNAPYDLLNDTASRIARGELAAAIVCGAETMRTRRKDHAAGRKTTYLAERAGAEPDRILGADTALTDTADDAAGINIPAHFYALAESALRYRSGNDLEHHLAQISTLWAEGSAVAATNPHARIGQRVDAETIATHGPANRRIAAPYNKLLTSNMDVDQASALVVCSYETAKAAGVNDDAMVYLVSGTGASDVLRLRSRLEFSRSNALRITGARALELAGMTIEEITHIDLYSCFPVAVQVAQRELGVAPDRPFTITGGMTFAGGPFNTYCLQAAAHSFDLLAGTDHTALLHGNGGYFSKESFVVASGAPPDADFVYERPQTAVDACPQRPPTDEVPSEGTIEAYTVTFDRDDQPVHAILSVLDTFGSRTWAVDDDPADVAELLATEGVTRRVALTPTQQIATARLH